jgi:succinoglycan biosynthesis protein ExoL
MPDFYGRARLGGRLAVKLAYFVHDVHDAAVARRVDMLQRGGARVVVLGFRRSDTPLTELLGAPVFDLGRTMDAKLAQRALSVLKHVAGAEKLREAVAGAQVVMARNLEMLAIAARVRALAAPRAGLVYECLDIHRMMLSGGVPGRLLRGLERRLLSAASLLVVSSPAFLRHYFEAIQQSKTPALLLENKVVVADLADAARPGAPTLPPGSPWRIGWYGVIRCARSLDILAALVRTHPGLVEVTIRGRPAYHEFDGFQRIVDETPGLTFAGAYGRDDLARIYGEVHFTWAIDYFEAGQNSDWLLPNRLYEGGLYGAVAIALSSVETGRWLAARQAGILLTDPASELADQLGRLTPEHYRMLFDRTAQIPTGDLATDDADARRLVERLAAA